jgi:hypothetical protein
MSSDSILMHLWRSMALFACHQPSFARIFAEALKAGMVLGKPEGKGSIGARAGPGLMVSTVRLRKEQGRGCGSWETSERRGLRCQGHLPSTHPWLWDRMKRGTFSGLPKESTKGSFSPEPGSL